MEGWQDGRVAGEIMQPPEGEVAKQLSPARQAVPAVLRPPPPPWRDGRASVEEL